MLANTGLYLGMTSSPAYRIEKKKRCFRFLSVSNPKLLGAASFLPLRAISGFAGCWSYLSINKAYFWLFLFLATASDSPLCNAATFEGPWIQGAMVKGKAAPGERVFFNGIELRQSADGNIVFGLGRDAPSPISVLIKQANGIESTVTFEVTQRHYDIQRVVGVDQKHVNPPDEVTERILEEARAIGAARKLDAQRTDFLARFIWPAKGPLTGFYGSQRFYNNVPKNPHFGIDIAGPVGSAVVAPAPGVVTFANIDLYYSGGTLIVDHGHGISSTFIHLSKIEVNVGDRVEQGDLIALIGASGRATGPHLDWRVNWFNERLDPQLLFPENAKPALE
jgi:hypothetical protein